MLAPCLLLLLAEAPSYGYELIDRLRALGFEFRGSNLVYQKLHALEHNGVVSSTWATRSPSRSGPVPRIYELTPDGHRLLEAWARRIAQWQPLLAKYMARYSKVAAPSCPEVE